MIKMTRMTGRKRIGLIVLKGATAVALVACVAALTAMLFMPRGTTAETGRSSLQQSGSSDAAGGEPEFKAGIHGLKMTDVRDYKLLWREIDGLQRGERADQISIAEYRSQAIEKTAQFLGLGGSAADQFASGANGAITTLRQGFLRWRQADGDSVAVEAQFSSDIEEAVTRVTSLLQEEPRHQLFAPDCKKWLLRLAFGPKESKETREAYAAREAKQGTRD